MNNLQSEQLIAALTDGLKDADILAAHYQSEISSAIINARISRNMNQAEFAQFLGISQGMVSKLENGDYNFTVSKLCELACTLNLDLNISLASKPENPLSYEGNIIRFDPYKNAHWKEKTSRSFLFEELKEM